jgi:hypothetical protein
MMLTTKQRGVARAIISGAAINVDALNHSASAYSEQLF